MKVVWIGLKKIIFFFNNKINEFESDGSMDLIICPDCVSKQSHLIMLNLLLKREMGEVKRTLFFYDFVSLSVLFCIFADTIVAVKHKQLLFFLTQKIIRLLIY